MAQLETPTISLEIKDKTAIKISGLAVSHALGYQVKISSLSGGGVPESVSPVDGVVTFSNRSPRTVYYISARSLGDDENYTNSDWSEEQTITTGADINQDLPVPSIAAAAETFTTLKITGLTQYAEYRFQIADSAEGVDEAPIRVTGNYGGYTFIRGLNPGNTYFIRFCLVEGNKCSLWSDVVSAATEAITGTIEVTSGADSGAGSLRQAINDAANGTKIILKVATITLNTVINNTAKRLFICGGLEARTVIQPGNNNAIFSITYLSGRHLKFTGSVGVNIAITNGHYDDCELNGIISTSGNGFASNAGFSNSEILDCKSGSRGSRYAVTSDSVISGCSATNNGTGGGTSEAVLNNCVIINNSASSNGGGASGGTLTNCTLTGNSASNGGGAYNCPLSNCLVVNNKKTSDNTESDVTEAQNSDTYIRSSTIGVVGWNVPTRMFVYNTLYKSYNQAPTGGNANNLSFDGMEEDYFVDAENGDYRLKYGAPAINAGDNQYVTTDTDLAGNPRIGGDNVDVGAYEFEPYKLAIPTFEITVIEGGQVTISYTLPEHSNGFCLEYSNYEDFREYNEIISSESGFDLSGLSGAVWFRAKAIGTAGITLDSDFTPAVEHYFDVTAPVVIVNQTPIEMVYGSTVNLLEGVTVVDDSGEVSAVTYQIIDRNNQPIEVDGQTTNPVSSGVPKGNYTLRITAADQSGNLGFADRGLAVLPPTLPAPVLSVKSVVRSTVTINGCSNPAAAGWKYSLDGTVKSFTPNEAGQLIITGLEDGTYTIKAKALGDWSQPDPPEAPSGDWRDSDWSGAISITISSAPYSPATIIEDRLSSVRKRISAIRAILEDPTTITDITIDGISERIDRRALIEELRMLERQELQLLNGTSGSRFHNVDTSRAW